MKISIISEQNRQKLSNMAMAFSMSGINARKKAEKPEEKQVADNTETSDQSKQLNEDGFKDVKMFIDDAVKNINKAIASNSTLAAMQKDIEAAGNVFKKYCLDMGAAEKKLSREETEKLAGEALERVKKSREALEKRITERIKDRSFDEITDSAEERIKKLIYDEVEKSLDSNDSDGLNNLKSELVDLTDNLKHLKDFFNAEVVTKLCDKVAAEASDIIERLDDAIVRGDMTKLKAALLKIKPELREKMNIFSETEEEMEAAAKKKAAKDEEPDNQDQPFAVVVTYSFDSEMRVMVAENYKKAYDYMEKDFLNEERIDIEENSYAIGKETEITAMSATLATMYPSETGYTYWNIVPVQQLD